MPRATIRLPTFAEPVPDWWEGVFHVRQQRARTTAIRALQRAGRPLSQGELRGYCGTYAGREIRHAVDALVDSGLIRRFTRREPHSVAFGHPRELVDRTYYELTE